MNTKRIQELQKACENKNAQAIIFSDSFSVRFFSGFWSSNALFCISQKNITLATDARYLDAAQMFFLDSGVQVVPYPRSQDDWKVFFQNIDAQNIGIEYTRTSTKTYFSWKEVFFGELKDVSEVTDRIRSQKTTEEIAAAQKASSIADLALKKSLPFLRPGISEKEFAWILEKTMREHGAEKNSFDPIIAFGKHSSVPHHRPTQKDLKKNMPILIDWGCVADGFCSDCTRCFWYGEDPDPEWIDAYEKVLEAQQKGIEHIAAEKDISMVQKTAEDTLGEKIPHSFGHGVGLEVHEYPTLSPKATGKFLKNMIVTAEPGIYKSDRFGIRIEDMGVVESSGFRSLTDFPKGLEYAILK